MQPVYINGKFYAGGLNGVHRVADRLIREYDRSLAALPAANRPSATLFVPRRRQWQPELHAIRLIEEEQGHTQRWEQVRLPRLAANGVLVNLCNLAPLRHARQLMLIHDAQFLFPDSGYPLRQRWGYRLLVPLMARNSASVLTVSDYSRQMLDVLGVISRDRTAVLYNGADHILDARADNAILKQHHLERGGYVLLFGSPKGYKNVAVVFEAMRQIADKVLVVVGSDRAALAAAGLTPSSTTIFVGKIDDADLRALYESAHCLAFPSRTEGFGLPPVEAMLCRCPVVASPAGAIPEVCRDTIAYADVDDPASWADAIRSADDRNAARAELRAQRFTWTKAGQDLARMIAELSQPAAPEVSR